MAVCRYQTLACILKSALCRDCLKYKVPRDDRMDEETDCLAVRIKSSVLRIMRCGSGNLHYLGWLTTPRLVSAPGFSLTQINRPGSVCLLMNSITSLLFSRLDSALDE